MPNKLTDTEIKKALECVLQSNNGLDKNNAIVALDLINRQEGENEKNENIIRVADKTIATLQAENESLKAEVERLNNNISAMATTLSTSARATRHEAYKECLDELARRLGYAFLRKHNCVLDIMENLLNELVGDGD